MTDVRVTVVFDLPELSAEEWERRRELFERVSLPTLIRRLASAVEQPQALRKLVENRMRGDVPVLAVGGYGQNGAET